MVTVRYEIRVRGFLGEAERGRFEEFETEVQPARTVFRGTIADQDQLHRLLARIESLGLELVELRQVGGRRR